MKHFYFILIFFSMILLHSCGGEGSSLEIGAPTYTSPKTPLSNDVEEEEDRVVINPFNLQKNDPCFKYIKHEVVVPVASCTDLENGRVKESYKSTVLGGRVCLLRKSFPNGVNLYTLIGEIQEKESGVPSRKSRVDVFGQSKLDKDLLEFEMKAEEQSFIKYNLNHDTVTVRQVSKVWKKKRRYYRLACRSLGNIVD